MDTKSFAERRMKANECLLKAIDLIDPRDPDAGKKFKEIADLYHELNADIKNELDHEQKKAELELEREKMDKEAGTKAEAIQMEREKTESQAHSDKVKAYLDISGKIAIAVSTVFAAVSQLWMFKRSTEKESDEALLTQTDQTIVRNGLSGRFFK